MYNQTYITYILLSLDYWASLTRHSTHLVATTHVPKPKLQTYNCLFGQTPRTCYIQQVKQLVLSEPRWRTPEDEDQGKHDGEKLLRLVDGDSDRKGMVVLLVVLNRDLNARERSLVEFGQLLPQHLISRAMGVVIFGVNRHARIGSCGVTSPLVVVPRCCKVDAVWFGYKSRVLCKTCWQNSRGGGT